jgi:RNA polymerase sigma-70 factor, ECF subfamily
LAEDSSLINQLKAGNISAFNKLVEMYRNRVINTCYRFLLDKQEAEDVSQEAFLEVYQSIQSFRGDAKLSTWIYRIAVTKSLDQIKKQKRKKRISSIGKIVHLDDLTEWLAGGAMPDRELGRKETIFAIAAALDALPDNQRAAFTLSKIDGYTNTEIADIMKTSVTAVESLVYRAKKALIKELGNILENNG